MKPRTNKTARARRWGRFLKLAGEAGTIAMSLRDKPGKLDWLGVTLRAVGIALNLRDERRRLDAGDPWQYFGDRFGVEWTEVPEEFRRLVMEHVADAVVDEKFWDGEDASPTSARA